MFEIKSHRNANIEWHCMQFELNWIQIEFGFVNWFLKYWIELRYNEWNSNRH
jgi:hypothetical protein